MRYRLRTLLMIWLICSACGCIGNYSSGSSKNLTPASVKRGDQVPIRIQLVILGAGSETPENSYSDEELRVRIDGQMEFASFPLRRTVPNDEVILEADIGPDDYGEAKFVEFFVQLKCDGVANRLPRDGYHRVVIQPLP